jgi:hypothetical protein
MDNSFNIQIDGFANLNDFVALWSPSYSYKNESKYKNHISTALEKENSFLELFKWKNGTGDSIAGRKKDGVLKYWDKVEVLRDLKLNFDWNVFEKEFKPHKKSTIWRLFLLHMMNPNEFPIFDQHVFRSYRFFTNGVIDEIPSYSNTIYQAYKDEYQPWFNNLKSQFNGSPKKMDESFFSFGQMLKVIKKYPIHMKHSF